MGEVWRMSDVKRVWRWWDLVVPTRARLSRPPEADRNVPVSREMAEAEWRWHYNNEQNRAAGCPCGRPAQVAEAHYEVTGTVPYLWWTCEDHVGAGMFAPVMADGAVTTVALYKHPERCPLGEYFGGGGPIDQPMDHFFCPHRDHAEADR